MGWANGFTGWVPVHVFFCGVCGCGAACSFFSFFFPLHDLFSVNIPFDDPDTGSYLLFSCMYVCLRASSVIYFALLYFYPWEFFRGV